MKSPRILSGLYDEADPRVSFSQLSTAASCLRWHRAKYEQGMKRDSKTARWGSVGHAALAVVGNALMKAGPEGLDPSALKAARRKLIEMRDYGLYSAMSEWMERWAVKMNGERASVIGVEYPMEAWVQLGAVKKNPGRVWLMDLDRNEWTRGTCKRAAVKMVGRGDMLRRGSLGNDCTFIDYKLWGSIPSVEELKQSFQFGLYNWALRQAPQSSAFGFNPLGVFTAEWQSIFADKAVSVPFDVEQADRAVEYARDLTLTLIETAERPETFSVRCNLCPLSEAGKCKTFKAEITGSADAKTMPATLESYLRLGARVSVASKWREAMKDRLKVKLEARAGVPLFEGRATAKLSHRRGGVPEKYLGMSREELLKELEAAPSTVLDVDWLPGRRPAR